MNVWQGAPAPGRLTYFCVPASGLPGGTACVKKILLSCGRRIGALWADDRIREADKKKSTGRVSESPGIAHPMISMPQLFAQASTT